MGTLLFYFAFAYDLFLVMSNITDKLRVNNWRGGFRFLVVFLMLVSALWPQFAQAVNVKNLGDPTFVKENSAALLEKAPGCIKVQGEMETHLFSLWDRYVTKVDSDVVLGRELVLPVSDQNWNNISPRLATNKKDELYLGLFYFCTPETIKSLTVLSDPLKKTADEHTVTEKLLQAIAFLAFMAATLGAWLLSIVLKLFAILLTANKFITHPFVKAGWPFVQGIANLGFIMALLFIAFATSLRLESYSARRMLPRLLIAALLINFSLVLTGLLIDLSRLVMAIMASNIAGNSLENMAPAILQKSAAFNLVFTGLEESGTLTRTAMADQFPMYQLQSAVMIWGLLGGFIVITVGFFVRYVALIILLIVSPIAFLAFALPGAQKLADKWWREFIKYLLYGPLALFVLVILVAMVGSQGGQSLLDVAIKNSVLEEAISLVVVVGMLIAAATVGKQVGITGSVATVGFVKGQGKKLMRAPITHPKTTAAVLGGAATAGVAPTIAAAGSIYGAKKAGKWAAENKLPGSGQAGDAVRYGKERFTKALPKSLRPIERDEKTGKPKPGQESVTTKWLNKVAGKPLTRQQAGEARQASSAINNAGNDPGQWDRQNLNAATLSQPHVINDAGIDTILNKNIAENTDTDTDVRALIKNDDFMKGLSGQQQIQFINQIRNNSNFSSMPNLTQDQRSQMSHGEIQNYEEHQRNTTISTKNNLVQQALENIARLKRTP